MSQMSCLIVPMHADGDGDDNLGTCDGVERPARAVDGAGDMPAKISFCF